MKVQQSFKNESDGALYVVPTPIGNLEDITYRALNVLKEAVVIAAEDTRNTKKLLNHFDIHTPLISYHEHSKLSREEQIVNRVEKGEKVALVSDAGMPAISDPGSELVRSLIERDQKVIVLPGANAALCALVGSGLPSEHFFFYGFLPRRKKDKEEELERLKPLQATLLFYESPYRIKETLKSMLHIFNNRKAVLARELTKRFEEYIRGDLDELMDWAERNEIKGECCLVVYGTDSEDAREAIWWSSLSVPEHVTYYIEQQYTSKEAIKKVAKERKMPKREVYQAFHINK
jgi:16S rRNA (cytidine1402-2'-O)-methyltransferase